MRQVWLSRLLSACSFSILTLNLVFTHGIPPEFRGGVHIFLPAPHTIGSVPSLSGHAIAYRLRSLPRVCWHRASSPQGSSSNGCCLCITMDQMLLCSSLFPHPLLIYCENVQIIGCIQSMCVCFLPIHSGQQVRWTYQPGSHRRKVRQDFSSTFFLRCVP